MTTDSDPGPWQALRPRLFGIAYRMLGVVADAEEVVQDAFVRWRERSETPRSDEAWLVAVTTRLAIDRLRRAATERKAYCGQWLPEPVPFAPPDRQTELADDLSFAFLLMLERLSPEERAAFLLREVLDAGYDEIATTLGKSEAACRQIVHRARAHIHTDRPRFAVDRAACRRVADRFARALHAADREGLLALLVDDAVLVADGGGRMPALAETQHGAGHIADLLVGFELAGRTQLQRLGAPVVGYDVVWLNGEPAVLTLLSGKLLFATVLQLEGDRIGGVFRVLNPRKLARLGRPTVLAAHQTLRELLHPSARSTDTFPDGSAVPS